MSDKALEETLLHEILHCVVGCFDHQPKWKRLAEKLNKEYNYNIQRCNSLDEKLGDKCAEQIRAKRRVEYKLYKGKCLDCGNEFGQRGKRKPKWYSHIDNYKCSHCKSNNLIVF